MSKSRWILLDVYQHGHERFSVFGRKNLKTGMLQFKVKNFCSSLKFWLYSDGMQIPEIDTQYFWNKLINCED